MVWDYLKLSRYLTISQCCMIAGCIVLSLGMYASINALHLLDGYIEHIQVHGAETPEPYLQKNPNQGYVSDVGEVLRDIKLPFTTSAHDHSHGAGDSHLVEELINVRAGLTYIWLFTLAVIVFCIIWITRNIHNPFKNITDTIQKLAHNELDAPIRLDGPKNVIDLSHELESLRKRLQNNDRKQMLYLRHVSHELKTPLASIKEGATLLNDSSLWELTQEQKEVTQILLRASNELQHSIEDLLAYNSVSAAQHQQQKERVNLAELLEKTIEKHQLSLQRNNITIKKIVSPVSMTVDVNQIETVFDNLLSNAIKYAPKNSEIRVWLKKGRYGSVDFTIRDEGPGVGKEHRESIFDAFYMGDESKNATVKGTGIGLSLAKQYVEAHNGSIRLLKSRTGATFKVSLENG